MESYVKSRGSFVDHKRKSLTLNNIFVDVTQEESKEEKSKHSIKSYLDALEKENKDWKEILKEKKAKLKNYEEQLKGAPMKITGADVERFTNFNDKQFMKETPNYLEMMESVKKYIDSVRYLNKYKLDVMDYYDKAYNELEIDKKILVEEMCASDLCEICNIKNCQRAEHKFFN